MEEILEVRDGCTTPIQLLKSTAFSKYVEIYKKQFIKDLKNRKDEDLKEDLLHKIDYIKSIDATTFIDILEGATPFSGDELKSHRDSVKFLDGAFHHYRTKSYTRLVRLHNEILEDSTDAETIKDKVSVKAEKLSELIVETRRILLIKAGLGEGVRRTKGLECHQLYSGRWPQPSGTLGGVDPGWSYKRPAGVSLPHHPGRTRHGGREGPHEVSFQVRN